MNSKEQQSEKKWALRRTSEDDIGVLSRKLGSWALGSRSRESKLLTGARHVSRIFHLTMFQTGAPLIVTTILNVVFLTILVWSFFFFFLVSRLQSGINNEVQRKNTRK